MLEHMYVKMKSDLHDKDSGYTRLDRFIDDCLKFSLKVDFHCKF